VIVSSAPLLQSVIGPGAHLFFESLAYFVAARVYWRARTAASQPPKRDRVLLLGCAIFGALIGSKALHALEHLPALISRAEFSLWLGGKSVLGGFLGGTLGVELGKRAIGWRLPTGDAWFAPIVIGLLIGRVGCQLSGTWDLTYGIPTALPWGWNYGDDVMRHPVAAYEILGVAALYFVFQHRWTAQPGARFAALLAGYCVLRFLLEWLKPPFGLAATDSLPVALFAGLTALQWAACVGTLWFTWLWRQRLAQTVFIDRPLP
jgi:phosphatidylglycerol---prolipoprotein diacylglyceryl transferase